MQGTGGKYGIQPFPRLVAGKAMARQAEIRPPQVELREDHRHTTAYGFGGGRQTRRAVHALDAVGRHPGQYLGAVLQHDQLVAHAVAQAEGGLPRHGNGLDGTTGSPGIACHGFSSLSGRHRVHRCQALCQLCVMNHDSRPAPPWGRIRLRQDQLPAISGHCVIAALRRCGVAALRRCVSRVAVSRRCCIRTPEHARCRLDLIHPRAATGRPPRGHGPTAAPS